MAHPLTVLASDTNPVLPDNTELILGAIAFAIVFFFLYTRALPGIKKLLDERTEAIEGGLRGLGLQQPALDRFGALLQQLLDAGQHLDVEEEEHDREGDDAEDQLGGVRDDRIVVGQNRDRLSHGIASLGSRP